MVKNVSWILRSGCTIIIFSFEKGVQDMASLTELREQLDAVDDEIVKLF